MFFFPISDENPTKKKPLISWFIISICIIIFLKYVFEENYIKEQIFISFGILAVSVGILHFILHP